MSPVCFHIFSRPVYWYGIMMATAFLLCVLHLTLLGRREGRPYAFIADLGFWVMLSGIIGARIAYVLADMSYFAADPMRIIRVDQGGLIFYGGFLGAVAAALIFAHVRRQNIGPFCDFAITALPLGQAIGRIGCLLNGCCYGAPSSLPWSIMEEGVQRHPTQIYEALYCLVVYFILMAFYRQRPRPGRVVALYLILYPLGRFALEFLRGDERIRWLGFTAAQDLSLAMILIGILLWFCAPKPQTAESRHDQRLS
jgi:phosphatidylglycerol---prolipoprotein diacylglyceryl transferase